MKYDVSFEIEMPPEHDTLMLTSEIIKSIAASTDGQAQVNNLSIYRADEPESGSITLEDKSPLPPG